MLQKYSVKLYKIRKQDTNNFETVQPKLSVDG